MTTWVETVGSVGVAESGRSPGTTWGLFTGTPWRLRDNTESEEGGDGDEQLQSGGHLVPGEVTVLYGLPARMPSQRFL